MDFFFGWYGMSQVVDYFGPMLGRRRSCWADVGPLAAMLSRLLGTFAWRIIMVVLHIAFCALCTHISMFVFICSLTIILCVLKTVQPTPLVVEPGRYSCIWLHLVYIYWYMCLIRTMCVGDISDCSRKCGCHDTTALCCLKMMNWNSKSNNVKIHVS